MNNTASEILWLLNLLLLNDDRPTLNPRRIFKKVNDSMVFRKDQKKVFIRKLTGYVSFLRGEDPVSYPIRLEPDVNYLTNYLEESRSSNSDDSSDSSDSDSFEEFEELGKLYYPRPKYIRGNTELSEEELNKSIKLYSSHMSFWQYKNYIKIVEDSLKRASRTNVTQMKEGLAFAGKQASLIVYPVKQGKVKDGKGLNGLAGFREAFETVKSGGQTKYKYKKYCK